MENVAQIESTYERVGAKCPFCGRRSVYSRVSDIGHTNPIDGAEVVCQNHECRRPIWIMGDAINPAHEMLVLECYDLQREKRYASCILSLAEAYEMFFSLYLRMEFAYRPYVNDRRLDRLNEILVLLYDTVKSWSYARIRNVFLNTALADSATPDLDAAAQAIGDLPSRVDKPSDASLGAVGNCELQGLLLTVNRTQLNELRNKVVHQQGYRPKAEEVARYIEETERVLFALPRLVGVTGDSINDYLARS